MTRQNVKIALVGLDHLSVIALSEILEDLSQKNYVCLDSPEDTLAYSGIEWFYIVSPMVIVEFFDFFIPRKQKTLVLSAATSRNNAGGIAVVSRYDNADTIKSYISELLDSDNSATPQIQSLSAREIEVLKLIAHGLTVKEIADSLYISVNTVNTHRKNITAKLGIRSASALSLYALMNGII